MASSSSRRRSVPVPSSGRISGVGIVIASSSSRLTRRDYRRRRGGHRRAHDDSFTPYGATCPDPLPVNRYGREDRRDPAAGHTLADSRRACAFGSAASREGGPGLGSRGKAKAAHMAEQEKAQIGVTGLSVMGRNLARNLARHGFRVALHNRSVERTRSLVAEHGDEGDFVPSESMQEFVASLSKPRAVIVMVKAGAPTDAVIEELVGLLEPGDIVIDCGNTHYTDTIRRQKDLEAKGLHFVGTGVSGGEEGALNGPSIMPGGSVEAYRTLGPIFETIAAQVEGTPCAVHVGPDGAGHFVKMVHNGIGYADMQLIAESYDLLRSGLGASPAQIADIFREWNGGEA